RLPHAGPGHPRPRPRNGRGRAHLKGPAPAGDHACRPRRGRHFDAEATGKPADERTGQARRAPHFRKAPHLAADPGPRSLARGQADSLQRRPAIEPRCGGRARERIRSHHWPPGGVAPKCPRARRHTSASAPLLAVPPLPERRSRRPLALVAALAAAFLLIATGTGVLLNQTTVVAARANLTIFQGTVDVRHGSGSFAAASTNDLVEQGDTIRTASGGHAALTFFDRSLVVLEPDTQVVLETLRTVAGGRDIDLVLRQVTGKTWHVVAHSIGDGGRYAVLTP